MVVSGRSKFYQNFPYNADPGLGNAGGRDGVKVLYDLTAHFLEFEKAHVLCRHKGLALFQPFLMEGVNASFFLFVRTHPVNTSHEQIPENSAVSSAHQHIEIQLKARIGFNTAHVQGNNGNLRNTGFFQGPADKSDIIGGTASAAGLRHNDRHLINVIFSG